MRYFLCARDSWDGTLLYSSQGLISACWTDSRLLANTFDRPQAIAQLRHYFDPKGKPLTTEPVWLAPAD